MKQNRVYQMAIEELENNAYDMQEDYQNDQIATVIKDIVKELNLAKGNDVNIDFFGSRIKVRNSQYWSFVSFSVGEYTGLSESIAEITDISRPIEQDEVKTLIEMLNEAWYQAVS